MKPIRPFVILMLALNLSWLLASCAGPADPTLNVTLSVLEPSAVSGVPADSAYTNGTIKFQASLGADQMATKLELLRDGVLLGTFNPDATFSRDTSKDDEGLYTFKARATNTQGTNFESATINVFVDRTRPKLELNSRFPATGDLNGDADKGVGGVFSEALRPQNLNGKITFKQDDVLLDLTPSLDGPENKILLVEYTAWKPGATIKVEFAADTGITDRAGNKLENPSEPWTFSFPAWRALGNDISNSILALGLTSARSLALDPTGKPVLAYLEATIGNSAKSVRVVRWDGTAWVPFKNEVLNVAPNSSASTVSLALTSTGSPVVAWDEKASGGISTVRVKYWDTVSASWKQYKDEPLNSDPGKPSTQPSLALSNDTPLVAYVDDDLVRVRAWVGGATGWKLNPSGPLNVDAAQAASNPSIAVRGSDSFVAWSEETDADKRNVHVKKATVQSISYATVNGNAALDFDVTREANQPQVALTSSGVPVVAWFEKGSGNTSGEVRVKYLDTISSSFKQYANTALSLIGLSAPSIQLNAQDQPMVAWLDVVEGGGSFQVGGAIKRWDGTDWRAVGTGSYYVPGDLDNLGTFGLFLPSLALNAQGVPHLAMLYLNDPVGGLRVKIPNL